MSKKKKMYMVQEPKKENLTVFHMSGIEAARANKPYIVPASKPGYYSKKDKACKKAERQLKIELARYSR